jgi:hypothetical protein
MALGGSSNLDASQPFEHLDERGAVLLVEAAARAIW